VFDPSKLEIKHLYMEKDDPVLMLGILGDKKYVITGSYSTEYVCAEITQEQYEEAEETFPRCNIELESDEVYVVGKEVRKESRAYFEKMYQVQ
jgi:hypothetical protein